MKQSWRKCRKQLQTERRNTFPTVYTAAILIYFASKIPKNKGREVKNMVAYQVSRLYYPKDIAMFEHVFIPY